MRELPRRKNLLAKTSLKASYGLQEVNSVAAESERVLILLDYLSLCIPDT